MANVKISQLTPASNVVGSELIPISIGGATLSLTPNQILSLLNRFSSNVTTQFDKTNDTNLQYVPGLLVNLVAGKNYTFEFLLAISPDTVGLAKMTLGGTAVITNFHALLITDTSGVNPTITNPAAVSNLNAAKMVSFKGVLTCSSSGTFNLQFAQAVASLTASSVLIGSSVVINEF